MEHMGNVRGMREEGDSTVRADTQTVAPAVGGQHKDRGRRGTGQRGASWFAEVVLAHAPGAVVEVEALRYSRWVQMPLETDQPAAVPTQPGSVYSSVLRRWPEAQAMGRL